MGREIRRVPSNWDHPKNEHGSYQPMFDASATERFEEWLKDFGKFKRNELSEISEEHGYDINDPYSAFCDWNGGPPDHQYHRPSWSEATWWQVYETVSEGTPVTPPFATQHELIEYLVANGDFWDQRRRKEGRIISSFSCEPWAREAAEAFVKGPGWAPSFVATGSEIKSGVEALYPSAPVQTES